MSRDKIQRSILSITDAQHVGVTTYDAKDPAAKYPPIEQLRPPKGAPNVFGLGPSVVALTQPGPWTIGVLYNQIWSVSGANDRADVNSMYLQPFVNYNLGGGLAAGVSVEASANYDADQTWTAPLLFNVSKVTLLGKRPVSFAVAAGPIIATPDAGASWRCRLSATFLFAR